MKVQARQFPVITMLMPYVLRRRPYQRTRRRCDALAQMLDSAPMIALWPSRPHQHSGLVLPWAKGAPDAICA
jgi:hypothetical protein